MSLVFRAETALHPQGVYFLVSSLGCLLVYRETAGFCMLILYSVTLLKVFSGGVFRTSLPGKITEVF